MSESLPCLRQLVCHPDTPTTAVKSIAVHLSEPHAAILALRFSLIGDLTRIRIPSPQPPRLRDRLWERSCFEVFMCVDMSTAYDEFNISPSGEWAVYHFRHYRQRSATPSYFSPDEFTRRDIEGGIEMAFEIDLHPLDLDAKSLSLGLSAVIEDKTGAMSYWALRHPAGKPDFHHADCFALELDALH